MRSIWNANLLDQVNGWLKVETEVNKGPIDAFPFVFFLFYDEHCMIEQLLQFFVCVVDTQLFERVQLKHKIATKYQLHTDT